MPVIVVKGSLLAEPETDNTGPQQPPSQGDDASGDDLLDALLDLGVQDRPVRGRLPTPYSSTGPVALSQVRRRCSTIINTKTLRLSTWRRDPSYSKLAYISTKKCPQTIQALTKPSTSSLSRARMQAQVGFRA